MEAYRRYGPALLRKAMRMLHNQADAQDIVQALFVDLLQRGEASPELSYLYRAVTHRCINLLRDRKNRDRLLAQNDESLHGPVRTSCEQRVIDLDLLMQLAQELDELGCEILVYRFLDDMTQEEIAELTGKSRKTVGKRLDAAQAAVTRLAMTSGGAA